MTLITWSDEYSVNIREIDQQHKKLIGIINELHEYMCVGDSSNAFQKIFDKLVNYTVFHFSFEEKLLAKYNYDKTDLHMRSHSHLIEQLKEFMIKYEEGSRIFSDELMNFLKDWLVNHIVGLDKKYSALLNSQGIT